MNSEDSQKTDSDFQMSQALSLVAPGEVVSTFFIPLMNLLILPRSKLLEFYD